MPKSKWFGSFIGSVLAVLIIVAVSSPVSAKPSRAWDLASQKDRNAYIVELALKQVGLQYPSTSKEWVKEIVFSASQFGLPQSRAIVLPETKSNGYAWKDTPYVYTKKQSQLIKAALPGQIVQMQWKGAEHTAIVGAVSSKTVTFLDVWPDPKRKNRNLIQKRLLTWTEVEKAVGAKFTIYEIRGGPPPKSVAKGERIVLQWPLATSYAKRVVTHEFGDPWAGGSECPPGVPKLHNGTDYPASAGTAVYAPADGLVKAVEFIDTWAHRIVIEHDHATRGKYTTVLMHVTPEGWVARNVKVTKGTKVAKVADLTPYGNDTHFHFGIRMGVYNERFSGLGALPKKTCTDIGKTFAYPGFKENFLDPEDQKEVLLK